MNTAKHLLLPATLAYAGVRGAEAVAPANVWLQIALGIVGAGLGLAIAKHI